MLSGSGWGGQLFRCVSCGEERGCCDGGGGGGVNRRKLVVVVVVVVVSLPHCLSEGYFRCLTSV